MLVFFWQDAEDVHKVKQLQKEKVALSSGTSFSFPTFVAYICGIDSEIVD